VGDARRGPPGHPRFAIRPYPKEWERPVTLRDSTAILIRPIRPEDEALYAPFFAEVTEQDLRLRFFALIKEFSHGFVARLTQLDYARAMAFIAIDTSSGALLGVGRLHANANYDAAEFAVLVRSDFKGRGLGWLLMQTMIDYASAEGLQTIEGQVLRDNTTMLSMCQELGFEIASDPLDADLHVVKLRVPQRSSYRTCSPH
jgi:acetyltransferase